MRYRLTEADQKNISKGLAHLGEILFAAGAKAIYPSLRSQPVLKSADSLIAQTAGASTFNPIARLERELAIDYERMASQQSKERRG